MKASLGFILVLGILVLAAFFPISSPQSIPETTYSTSTAAANPMLAEVPTVPYETLRYLFVYDPDTSLEIQETSIEDDEGIMIHDFTFASPGNDRAKALLVIPRGAGPFPGIIFIHSGEADRTQFLGEAKEFARNGAIGLLLEVHNSYKGNDDDRDQLIKNIIDLRRGIDLLTARADVDPQRIGFIGFSSGADMGAVLAGVDKRIKTYVFMSATGRRSNGLKDLFSMDPQEEAEFIGSMAQLDAIHFIRQAAPAALFFQNGLNDQSIPKEDVKALQEAASEPKLVKWYDAYQDLNGEAKTDRAVWIASHLMLAELK